MSLSAPTVASAISQTHGRALRELAEQAGPRGLHKRVLVRLAVEAISELEVELVDWRRVRLVLARMLEGRIEEREAARRFFASS